MLQKKREFQFRTGHDISILERCCCWHAFHRHCNDNMRPITAQVHWSIYDPLGIHCELIPIYLSDSRIVNINVANLLTPGMTNHRITSVISVSPGVLSSFCTERERPTWIGRSRARAEVVVIELLQPDKSIKIWHWSRGELEMERFAG